MASASNSQQPPPGDFSGFTYVAFLSGAMISAIALTYWLSNSLITKFPPPNIFFGIFWSFVGVGVVLLSIRIGESIIKAVMQGIGMAFFGTLSLFIPVQWFGAIGLLLLAINKFKNVQKTRSSKVSANEP